MGEELADRLKRLMRERGFSALGLSRAAGLGQRAVSDILEGKSQSPRVKTVRALAAALGVSVEELTAGDATIYQRVLVIGHIGDNEAWTPATKTVDEVELRLEDGEPVAVDVRTKTLMPVYRPGDRLLGVKYPAKLADMFLGLDCIIETWDGRHFIKFLDRGTLPGRYNLRSYFPGDKPIENVKLRWVAPIDLIRRARR